MRIIKLKASDGHVFTVDVRVAMRCSYIKPLVEDVLRSGKDEVVPVDDINGQTLEAVFNWLEHYDLIVKHSVAGNYVQDEWDTEYFKMDKSLLYSVLRAATHLELEVLRNHAATAVGILSRPRSPRPGPEVP